MGVSRRDGDCTKQQYHAQPTCDTGTLPTRAPASTHRPADSIALKRPLRDRGCTGGRPTAFDASLSLAARRWADVAGRDNAAVLIDPFYFSRSRCRIEDVASVPPSRFHLMQFCDVPAEIPPTMAAILAQAPAERLLPGDGGATERARRARPATKRVMAQLDACRATGVAHEHSRPARSRRNCEPSNAVLRETAEKRPPRRVLA